MRGWVGVLVAAAVVATAVAIGVILVATSGSATALLDLELGDCFDLPTEATAGAGDDVEVIDTVDVVPCDRPHDAEVVALGALNPDGDEAYPSDDQLFARVDERCRSVDRIPLDRFGVVPIAPTERWWASFDGRFLCLAIPYGGEPTTGSIAVG